ncbi:putative mitochondrial protein [Lineolata rhizophorae]|uniref:MICOS complex subunit n=1 Tax=Lineolata rhizophorae TaxID=578093 RepID=A0A6A6P771_9PEZI|nr:putative mitochondrial protein [Lineolata rhizophorae]
MAFRSLMRQRYAAPLAATLGAAGLALYPRRYVHAEAPPSDDDGVERRPIYDDKPSLYPPPESSPSDNPPPPSPSTSSPTPTDRLTVHIKRARLFLHGHAVVAEDKVNELMTSFLNLESSFTSTIAGLAPPRESGERLLPNGIYVLVAAMAGSIVTRNRNIVLRASVPVAVGVGAAYAVLPITMRNVGDLVWTYEEKYPALAENHIRIKERVQRFWETGKAHTAMTGAMIEDKVSEARGAVEDWVKKGK